MIYFNISGIGVLTLDKILFEFDNLPILVVCLDTSGNRYFCLCTDPIMEFPWLISRISLNSLIDVIQNKISVLDAFKNSNNKIYLYNDLKKYVEQVFIYFNDIPEDELPDDSEKLENPNLTDYLNSLCSEYLNQIIKQTMHFVYKPYTPKASFILKDLGIQYKTESPYRKNKQRFGKGFNKAYNSGNIFYSCTNNFTENYVLNEKSKNKNTKSDTETRLAYANMF